MARLDAHYEKLYDAVLQEVATVEDEPRKLSAFWPAIGAEFQPGESLLAIGRAVNGWGSISFRAPELRSGDRRAEVIDGARSYKNDENAPLSWVVEREGADGDYNTRRSQFWMVLRSVMEELHGDVEGSWSGRLAWSNLYKVAPHDTDNPTGRLKTIQRNESGIELLREEIRQLMPRAVLFLTGPGWAGHFLDKMKIEWVVKGRKGLAVDAGRLGRIPLVVSRHPQGKKRSRWVDETLMLLEQAEA